MAEKTLEQILGFRTLLGIVEELRGNVATGGLPAGLFNTTRGVEGNQGSYLRVSGNRQVARIVQYGSPSQARAQLGISEQPVTLLHAAENMMHKPQTLSMVRDMDNAARQDRGRQEIDRQTAQFFKYFTNLRRASVCSALALGKIHFDVDGNLLPTSGSAVTTIDYGIPAGNQNSLDVFGAGALISATWATAGTDIFKQMANITEAAVKLTGYPIANAIYGKNILHYLAINTDVSNFIKSDSVMATALRNQQIPQGMFGIANWAQAWPMFYEDQKGVIRNWVDDDNIIFFPEVSADWYEMLEGTYLVPTELGNVSRDAVAMLSNVEEVSGFYTYASLNDDPITIKHIAGDTFLPVIKVPSAVFIGHFTP